MKEWVWFILTVSALDLLKSILGSSSFEKQLGRKKLNVKYKIT